MKASTINRLREWSITLLRVGTGTTFLIHDGEQLLLEGFSGRSGVECLCGAALVLGLFTRWVTILLAVGMIVDVFVIHWPNSFFSQDAGFEYALLCLSTSLTLVLSGPGQAALGNIPALQRISMLSCLQR